MKSSFKSACKCGTAVMWALSPALAMAQTAQKPDDIVVTATRYGKSLADLPARVTVVTAADLQRLAIEKLDDALAYVAGVTTNRQDGAYSFTSVVSLRGLSTAQQGRTLVLLDGVPVNTSATGGVNWNRIPIEMVERIEVFKGPGSSIYGGDAVGGVINIITRRPRRKAEAFAVGEVASYQTDNERGMVAARSSGTASDFYLRGYGYYGHSKGYNSTPDALKTDKNTTYTNRTYQEHGGAGLAGYGWKMGSAEFEYTNSDDFRQEGTRIRALEGANRCYGLDTYRVSGEGKFGETGWRLLGYRQQELYRRLLESQSGTTYARTDTTVDRRDYNLSGSISRPIFFDQKLSLGGEFKAGRVNGVDRTGAVSLNDAGKMDTYAFYLQDDVSPGEGYPAILASARYDAARFYDGFYSNPNYPTLTGPLAAQNWEALTWRASARQRLAESFSAYLSYSRGFRQPSLEDMVLNLVKSSTKYVQANPNLGPEKIDTYELGADYVPVRGLKLSPSLFYSRGVDFIYSVPTGVAKVLGRTVYQSQNVASVDIYGVEAEAAYAADPAMLSVSYTFNRSRISSCRQNAALNGNDLAYAPQNQAAASLGWRFPWLNASASWRYKGTQFSDDNTLRVSPYSTLACKAWRRLGAGLTVSAALENALDKRYQESTTDLAPGRTEKAALTWEF